MYEIGDLLIEISNVRVTIINLDDNPIKSLFLNSIKI